MISRYCIAGHQCARVYVGRQNADVVQDSSHQENEAQYAYPTRNWWKTRRSVRILPKNKIKIHQWRSWAALYTNNNSHHTLALTVVLRGWNLEYEYNSARRIFWDHFQAVWKTLKKRPPPSRPNTRYTPSLEYTVYFPLPPFFFRSILYTNGCRSVVFHIYRIPMQYTTITVPGKDFSLFFPLFFLFSPPPPFFFLFFSLPLSSVHQYLLSIYCMTHGLLWGIRG